MTPRAEPSRRDAGRVLPGTLRAVAFLVLSMVFALGAASLALSALVVHDDGVTLAAVGRTPGESGSGPATASASASTWQPDTTRDARDFFDGVGTVLAPVGFAALAWATLMSLDSPHARRLILSVAAFVAGFVLFGPLERPLLAVLGFGDVSPFIAGIPGAVAFSAALALAVSAAGSRLPVLVAAFAGAMGVLNRVLYAMLPDVWSPSGSSALVHALPLVAGWLAAALYAGALAAAGFIEARKGSAPSAVTAG